MDEHADHPWPWCHEAYCLHSGADGYVMSRWHWSNSPNPGNHYWKCQTCGRNGTRYLSEQGYELLAEQSAERVQPRLL